MNKVNVQHTINIMTRVKDRDDTLDMSCWQRPSKHTVHHEKEMELHWGGSAADLAGWVAVSPEFIADGGYAYNRGKPVLKTAVGAKAIAHWLNITEKHARLLTTSGATTGPQEILTVYPDINYKSTDGMFLAHITPDHVIAALTRLLKTGSPRVNLKGA